ncbi:MAG: hypothetical protein QM820_23145 [Minicystis sp.]
MSRLRQRLLAAALAALALTGAGAARADELAIAQALVDEGNRAAAAADYATALDRFRAAYARYRSANILLNIGTTLQRLGRGPEAAVVYEQYLRDPGANPARVPEIRRALADIDATIARVTIGTSDTGARVWVDGGELNGFAPGGMVRLAPGEHTIAAGREAPIAAETIRVAPGEARSVYLRLPAPPAPLVAPPVPAPPAVVLDAPEAPTGPRRASSPLGGIAVGFDIIGGLAFAGGIAGGVVAVVMNHDASSHCLQRGPACEPRAIELENGARKAGQISSVLFGTGAAAIITGAILHAVDRSSRRDGMVPRGPRVAVGPGFVGVEGSW